MHDFFLVLIGTAATAGLALGGWAAAQVIKVPSIEAKVDYLVNRVDYICDNFIRKGPEDR